MTLATKTITSTDVKVEILAWLRYTKGLELVCTEAGPWSADVVGVSMGTGSVSEVEVKVSVADLKREATTKKAKHWRYANGPWAGVPNYFYVAVPETLVEKATKIINELNSSYGLISIPEGNRVLGRSAIVVVRPKSLHKQKISAAFQRVLCMRMSSELVGVHALYNEGLSTVTYAALNVVSNHLESLNSNTEEVELDFDAGAGI